MYTSQTEFQSDLILGLATKSAISPQLIAGSSPNLIGYMTEYPGFLFDLLLKVTEVKVQNVTVS
jgi:hypothetical protein